MITLVLDTECGKSPIEAILRQAANGGVEIRDLQGKVVAYVLTPTDREAWAYAEANLEVDQHSGEIEQALARRGGITTAELLERAAADAQQNGQE